jgi:hypothetical protein
MDLDGFGVWVVAREEEQEKTSLLIYENKYESVICVFVGNISSNGILVNT